MLLVEAPIATIARVRLRSTQPQSAGTPNKPKSGFPVWIIVVIVAVALVPIGLAVVGVVAALGIYGTSRYIAAAKSAEARMTLGRMSKDAVAAYNREELQEGSTQLGKGAVPIHRLCASASRSVPSSIEAVRGRKYQSSPAEWTSDPPNAGFTCLKFALQDPQYYMYSYQSTPGPNGEFTATANGDLNGNGVASTFTLSGKLETSGNASMLVISPRIVEVSPNE